MYSGTITPPRAFLLGVTSALLLSGTVAAAEDLSFRVGLGAGYGIERLTWNIAGAGGSPNVLSELTFEELESVVGRLDLQLAGKTWSLDGEVTYGLIMNGTFRDDDFAFDNRVGLFSRSTGSVDDHDLQGAALLVGYALSRTETTALRVLVGGRVYRQRLRLSNGVQEIPATGAFANLNSTYTATWYGPALGASFTHRFPETNVGLSIDGTGMLLWYDGEGKWNLRTDFRQDPSFRHEAIGWGAASTVRLSYFLGRAELFAGGRAFYFSASDGDDTTFFSDGTQTTVPFNEVTARGLLGLLGLAWTW